MTELTQKWQQCQLLLHDNLTASAYQTWFAPIMPLSYEDNVLTLQVNSEFVVEYIEENYISLLSSAIRRVFGNSTRLEYRVLIDSVSGAGSTIPSPGSSQSKPVVAKDVVREPREAFDTQLNETYTFDTFIAGEPNKLARVAGLTIAKQPGYNAFNPLFIYGGSGVLRSADCRSYTRGSGRSWGSERSRLLYFPGIPCAAFRYRPEDLLPQRSPNLR